MTKTKNHGKYLLPVTSKTNKGNRLKLRNSDFLSQRDGEVGKSLKLERDCNDLEICFYYLFKY